MKFNKEHWKEIDINIDSLWLIGPRAKGGKRENVYHGNFVPQIPDHLIRRYTDENSTVLEIFMGSGTTLYECERLNRNYIGFDINEDIIAHVSQKISGSQLIKYCINDVDVTDTDLFNVTIKRNFKDFGIQRCDFVISHPPYWNIIKFTEKKEDLSNIVNLEDFIKANTVATKNAVTHLRMGKYFAIVVGDLYRDGEIVPLGFYVMNSIRNNINCELKGIVVKDIVGNKAKLGMENLWRYRTLKSDTFLFKHEYIFVFKKVNKRQQQD